MELGDIPFERDGEYLCSLSSFESLPLVPHRQSPLVTSIIGSDNTPLCFRHSKKTIIYFTPCTKLSEKVYRRAKETDTEIYLLFSKKSILLPNNSTISQQEYVNHLRSSFLSYEMGCFYLSSLPNDKIYKISKEIYQTMKRS